MRHRTTVFTLSLLLTFVFTPNAFAEVNYYYKGSGGSYIYQSDYDSGYKDSNMEWATLTAHQFFDVNTGRAKVRVFSRSKAAEWMFGYAEEDVTVYSISAALKDIDPKYELWIYDALPRVQEKNYSLIWHTKFLALFLVVIILTF
ncbi:MAG: hypothetical protein FH758_00830 [Firmicutes bacterium]|nr:hypothetical protein [Bacillota bacterium]